MDQTRDAVLVSDQVIRPTHPSPQTVDKAADAAGEITAISNIEERFANWGTD